MLDQLIHQLVVPVLYILAIVLPLVLAVAMFVYWERKVLGWIQNRIGPNRVGWKGTLQPFADVLKMLFKELIVPANSNKFLFLTAPVLSLVPALVVWAAVPDGTAWIEAAQDLTATLPPYGASITLSKA